MMPTDYSGNEQDAPVTDARFDQLFDIASRNNFAFHDTDTLTPTERQQVQDMREVLDVIDAGWGQASASELDDIETRFLSLLEAEEPDHPWVLEKARTESKQLVSVQDEKEDDAEVTTLGQLVEVTADDAPQTLPREALEQLLLNQTLITDLMDNQKRQAHVGAALKQAEVPAKEIPQTYQWLNQGIRSLMPLQSGAFLARRQQRKRSGEKR